jgi:uncharacterized protein with PIN domain
MATGICPYCKESLERISFETIRADGPKRQDLRALAMLCPDCNSILGVTLHPMALARMAVPQKKA